MEVLRAYASHRSNAKLIGALRGQFPPTQYRFGSGHGTFTGPYFGIDQPVPRLTLEQFKGALREMQLNLPQGEIEAVFNTIDGIDGDVNGSISLSELLREIRAEPSDRAVYKQRKHLGQIWSESRKPTSSGPENLRVRPTVRSGYSSQDGYRKAPVLPAENVPPPKPQPPPVYADVPYRIAPPDSDSTPFNSGANALKSNVYFGPSEESGEWHRKAPPGPPKVSRGNWAHVGRGPQLHTAEVEHPDRWVRDTIGQSRPVPRPTSNARVMPPDPSPFTRSSSVFIGGDPEPPPPPPPPPPTYTVLKANPWVSGYNRSGRNPEFERTVPSVPPEWNGVQQRNEAWESDINAPPPKNQGSSEWSSVRQRKEAWAFGNAQPPKKKGAGALDSEDFIVVPSRESGWVSNEGSVKFSR
jgi:hypothetical protein